MFINLSGQFFNSDLIFSIRPIDDSHCVLFPAGADPIAGGFLIELSIEEILRELAKVEDGSFANLADQLQDEIDALSVSANQKNKK